MQPKVEMWGSREFGQPSTIEVYSVHVMQHRACHCMSAGFRQVLVSDNDRRALKVSGSKCSPG